MLAARMGRSGHSPSWRKAPALEETPFKYPENSKRKMGSSLTLQEDKAQHLGRLPPGVLGAMERFGRKVGRPRGSHPGSTQLRFASHPPGDKFSTSQVRQPGIVCRCPTWEGCVGQVLPEVLRVPEGPGGGSPPPHRKLSAILHLCLHPLCQSVLSGVPNMCIDAFQPSGDGLALIQRALG